ncbi:MAG: transcription antitermination factor NusB [Eubacteriales bacterium]|nr:transcription antitermination factor NusB [Lachnospiraceae bacterium]MDO5126547.1 transcription antitermination factor NusB [Eubacteriales bacterium]
MTRRALREQIFRIIFRVEFNSKDEMMEQIGFSVSEIENLTPEDETYIVDKSGKILTLIEDIDEEIMRVSDGWNIRRIGKAELALLRLAIYEMKYDEDVPYKVAINEALELAKIYCSEDARSFINGLLAKVSVE